MAILPDPLRMKRDHRWARTRLSDYIDGDLSPDERRRVADHADLCPECGPLLRALTVTVFRLRQLRVRPSEPVAPRVIERLRELERR